MLSLRHVQLNVLNLTPCVDFYTRQLGFVVVRQTAAQAELAVAPGSTVLLTLTALPTATRAPEDSAGLFHAALLLPTRAALGGWLRHVAQTGVEFDGFSDHGVSEAIYLRDPEGNGLEFYADRAPSAWPRRDGQIEMFTRPLDVKLLLAAAAPASGSPLAGAHWGHLHLRVTELDRSERFYRDTLGVVLTQGTYPGARFLAADGYHHHLRLNTWSHPRNPQPPNAAGLAEATFAGPLLGAERLVRDPDAIALRLVAA